MRYSDEEFLRRLRLGEENTFCPRRDTERHGGARRTAKACRVFFSQLRSRSRTGRTLRVLVAVQTDVNEPWCKGGQRRSELLFWETWVPLDVQTPELPVSRLHASQGALCHRKGRRSTGQSFPRPAKGTHKGRPFRRARPAFRDAMMSTANGVILRPWPAAANQEGMSKREQS